MPHEAHSQPKPPHEAKSQPKQPRTKANDGRSPARSAIPAVPRQRRFRGTSRRAKRMASSAVRTLERLLRRGIEAVRCWPICGFQPTGFGAEAYFALSAAGVMGLSGIPSKVIARLGGRQCLSLAHAFVYCDFLGVRWCEVLPAMGVKAGAVYCVDQTWTSFASAHVMYRFATQDSAGHALRRQEQYALPRATARIPVAVPRSCGSRPAHPGRAPPAPRARTA